MHLDLNSYKATVPIIVGSHHTFEFWTIPFLTFHNKIILNVHDKQVLKNNHVLIVENKNISTKFGAHSLLINT